MSDDETTPLMAREEPPPYTPTPAAVHQHMTDSPIQSQPTNHTQHRPPVVPMDTELMSRGRQTCCDCCACCIMIMGACCLACCYACSSKPT